jgi:hypothetical protein
VRPAPVRPWPRCPHPLVRCKLQCCETPRRHPATSCPPMSRCPDVQLPNCLVHEPSVFPNRCRSTSLLAPRALPTEYCQCPACVGPARVCSSKIEYSCVLPSLSLLFRPPPVASPRIHIHVAHVSAVPFSTPLTACCRSQAAGRRCDELRSTYQGTPPRRGIFSLLHCTALCLTASDRSPPRCLSLPSPCLLQTSFQHPLSRRPSRAWPAFLLRFPSPSLPPSLPLTLLPCLRWPHFDQGNLSTATHLVSFINTFL